MDNLLRQAIIRDLWEMGDFPDYVHQRVDAIKTGAKERLTRIAQKPLREAKISLGDNLHLHKIKRSQVVLGAFWYTLDSGCKIKTGWEVHQHFLNPDHNHRAQWSGYPDYNPGG